MEDFSLGEDSSWIGSSPWLISLLICVDRQLSYALSGKNWGCRTWVDLCCTTAGLKVDLLSQVGLYWWRQDQNSHSDSPDCCLGETNIKKLVLLTSLLLLKREKQKVSLLIYIFCVDVNPLDHFYILSLINLIEYQNEEVKSLSYMMENEQDCQSQERIEVFGET